MSTTTATITAAPDVAQRSRKPSILERLGLLRAKTILEPRREYRKLLGRVIDGEELADKDLEKLLGLLGQLGYTEADFEHHQEHLREKLGEYRRCKAAVSKVDSARAAATQAHQYLETCRVKADTAMVDLKAAQIAVMEASSACTGIEMSAQKFAQLSAELADILPPTE